MRRSLLLSAALTVGFLAANAQAAVMVGQVNDFEDGTTQNWAIAGAGRVPMGMLPNTPINVDSGALSGKALRLNASGMMGPGGRMTAFNFFGGWEGDYIGAGVSGIEMDLYNPSSESLSMRILFGAVTFDSMGAPVGVPGAYYTANPIVVGPNSTVLDAVFSTLEGDLVDALGGSSNYAETLADIAFIRLFHNPDGGTAIFGMGDIAPLFSGALEIDNVEALGSSGGGGTVIPEPSTALLLGLGLGALAVRRRETRGA